MLFAFVFMGALFILVGRCALQAMLDAHHKAIYKINIDTFFYIHFDRYFNPPFESGLFIYLCYKLIAFNLDQAFWLEFCVWILG